jgi:hypothetical protein
VSTCTIISAAALVLSLYALLMGWTAMQGISDVLED